jgi:hypothetical protein
MPAHLCEALFNIHIHSYKTSVDPYDCKRLMCVCVLYVMHAGCVPVRVRVCILYGDYAYVCMYLCVYNDMHLTGSGQYTSDSDSDSILFIVQLFGLLDHTLYQLRLGSMHPNQLRLGSIHLNQLRLGSIHSIPTQTIHAYRRTDVDTCVHAYIHTDLWSWALRMRRDTS